MCWWRPADSACRAVFPVRWPVCGTGDAAAPPGPGSAGRRSWPSTRPGRAGRLDRRRTCRPGCLRSGRSRRSRPVSGAGRWRPSPRRCTPSPRRTPSASPACRHCGDVLEEFVGELGAVQPDQHVLPEGSRQPGDRQVEQGDIVVRAVGGGGTMARVDRQHVAGVVAGCQVWAKSGAALIGRLAFSLSEPASTIEASRSITVIPVSSFPATFSQGNPSGRRPAGPTSASGTPPPRRSPGPAADRRSRSGSATPSGSRGPVRSPGPDAPAPGNR